MCKTHLRVERTEEAGATLSAVGKWTTNIPSAILIVQGIMPSGKAMEQRDTSYVGIWISRASVVDQSYFHSCEILFTTVNPSKVSQQPNDRRTTYEKVYRHRFSILSSYRVNSAAYSTSTSAVKAWVMAPDAEASSRGELLRNLGWIPFDPRRL